MEYVIGKMEKGETEQGNSREWNYVKFTMLQIQSDYDDAIDILRNLKKELKGD